MRSVYTYSMCILGVAFVQLGSFPVCSSSDEIASQIGTCVCPGRCIVLSVVVIGRSW